MLDFAIKHKKQLSQLYQCTWYNEYYKYYSYDNYFSSIEIQDNTWYTHQFVSLDTEGNVLGYISYSINRTTQNCENLNILNFTKNVFVFSKDLIKVIRDIFMKFNFNKLSFSVVIGNPVEKQYDKLIEKYNGRIIGIKKKQVKLWDNNYYDVKEYEILKEEFLGNK